MLIHVTGRMRVNGPAGSLDASQLPGRQGRLVLASLAVTEQPVAREVLADRVWADRLPRSWQRDLSAVISKLRALLGRVGLGGPRVRVHLDSGNRAAAVRAYERARALLAGELGVDPAPETEQLYLAALRSVEPSARTVAPSPPVPEVRYARSGRVSVAYQVVGDGPVDMVLVPGWISNLELAWDEPRMATFLRRLATSCRLVLFDKRGTGLSDPIPLDAPPSLEERMDDVRAVMDAVGSERAVVLGFSEGGVMSALFAAGHPDRTAGLLLWGTWARQQRGDDFPWGWTREEGMRRFVRPIQQRGVVGPHWFAPSAVGDPGFREWFDRYARQSASPGMAIALLKANAQMDVRDVLPTIRVPTLVLHRTDDVLVPVGQGRYLAEHIPGARLVEFPGHDHWPWLGETEPILDEIGGFLRRAAEPAQPPPRMLATVLAARVPAEIDIARPLTEHRGVLIEPDRLLARFDGPGRAVECAQQIVRTAHRPGRECRIGIHTGEVTLDGPAASGVAIDLACEVADRAAPGEVLVTRTVTDLVAGSRLRFASHGAHHLRTVGAEWQLAAAR